MQQQRKSEHSEDIAEIRTDNVAEMARTVRFSELTLAVTDDIHAVEAEWCRLQGFTRNSLHQSFGWCLPWINAHNSECIIVSASVAGRALILLPLEIVREKGIRIARLPGDRFNNINTGLFDPDLVMPDAEELQNFAYGLRVLLQDRADLVVLDNIPTIWRGMRHPLSDFATIENQNHSFQLPLFANFEATLAQLNAKSRRKKFRSSGRKLEAIGGYEHFIPETSEEKHALLDLFFRQKGERLLMLGLPDVFSAPETRAFFHGLLEVPADGKDAPLVLHAIRLKGEYEGHISAIAGLSRKGDHVICQFSSIDETICPEASPGELLFFLMIEHTCREGAAIFDFGVGDQPYKRNWCKQETVQHDILLPLTKKGALLRPLLVAVTKAKSAIKRNQYLYTMAQRWRSRRCPAAQDASASQAETD